MTFSGQKYYNTPVNNGNVDKNEPGKDPKPTYKKMDDNIPPKKNEPVTDESKKKYTDMMKKSEAEQIKPGTKLAKPGQSQSTSGDDMRAAQIAAAKEKAEEFKRKYGVYPTAANIKKYGSK